MFQTTIMVVEHNIKGVLETSSTAAYVLDMGAVVFEGTPKESGRPTS